ncbi:hypothetical protein [Paenibacillus senegalensis]|uniref:hypothetical protein n=1 Tax=Paenibacillus senegalensis TaxID=1465766 RepID=UPI000289CAAB|nr:hypothetical protein [Paenibacillus senegalensis]
MAFGVTREELNRWKQQVAAGNIAYLTHYWLDPRFPGITSVTKVGCSKPDKLIQWCMRYGLNPRYIHLRSEYPHFDLIGPKQLEILQEERLWDHIRRFSLQDQYS